MGGAALVVNKSYFFCDALRHAPLLQAVLGHSFDPRAAMLSGVQLHRLSGCRFPVIIEQAGCDLEGILVEIISPEDIERLAFFAAGLGMKSVPVSLSKSPAGQPTDAVMFRAIAPYAQSQLGAVWLFDDWQSQYGAQFTAMARDYMAQLGAKSAPALAARMEQMLARAASRKRAETPAPSSLRFAAKPKDVAVSELREPYARFFAMEEIDAQFRRFDGSMSPKVTRAGFIACDAVTVLPYDPVRDQVLVVDQFRAGPYLRGDPQPWQIEAIAGRIDAGESPQDAARREAVEEAGLTLDALHAVASYYPTPGCSAEFLYSYVAVVALPQEAAGVFGLEGEAEDIRGHVISFDRLMELVGSGEISNAPTILTAYWLAQNREKLRAI